MENEAVMNAFITSGRAPKLLRRFRRHRWLGVGLLVLLVTICWSFWWVYSAHILASSAITFEGGWVNWGIGRDTWKVGGATLVNLSQHGGRSHWNDETLSWVGDLHRVNALNLSGCANVTDKGLKVLEKLPHLQSLDLSRTVADPSYGGKPLTDASLKHVEHLTELKELILDGNNITDRGMSHLSRLANLEMLSLRETRITDDGLQALRGLKNLQFLDVRGTAVTLEGTTELLDEIPGLEITQDPRTPDHVR